VRARLLVAGFCSLLAGLMVTVVAASGAGRAPGSPLPHGGAVVFASDLGIYVENADGTALTRLTTGSYDGHPVWSKDAKYIAFDRIDYLDDSVRVISPDGGGMRRVGSGLYPVWSPDGTKIAFSNPIGVISVPAQWSAAPRRAGRALQGGFNVVNVDGTGTRRLGEGDVQGYTWSPDGKTIAYTVRQDPRIHVVDVSSGASTTLGTASFKAPWGPAWSPDGTTIALSADGGLKLIDAVTGQVTATLIRQIDPYCLVWSPDSTRVAFFSHGGLFTIDRDGHGQRRLATASGGDPYAVGAGARSVSWSADGLTLFYDRQRFSGSSTSDIWRVGADGTGAKPITSALPTGANYSDPQWAATTIPSSPAQPISMLALRPSRTLTTAAVLDLSADGGRAAVAARGGETGNCGPVGIWAGASVSWLGGSSCDWSRDEFVLAGTRAAWIYTDMSMPAGRHVTTGATGSAAATVAEAWWGSNPTVSFGNLAGDAALLVYNTSKVTWAANDPDRERPPAITEPKLWRIIGTTSRVLLSGPDARDVVAVDAGRIAVLRHDGTLVILNTQARRMSAFHLGVTGVSAARLTGSQLVVLRNGTIEARDATRGTMKHRWLIAPSGAEISLEDAQGNFAAYTSGIAIHLLRLSDGRDRVLQIANEAGPAHAELEPAGLYYSYNAAGKKKPGRVAFVPLEELTARFG
jgi:Tol biopolymer transport system component